MKAQTNILAALSIVGSVIAAPAAAACLDEITQLNGSIDSALIDASEADRQAARVESDAAKVLCVNGDENGAAERIANANALLGM